MQPNFDEIFDRFDTDEVALRYIWEHGVVAGIFIGSTVTAIIGFLIHFGII